MSEKTGRGVLYVVATPIGNLGDITQRALDVLASVDWIAAEDTRHSRQLLQHYGISTPLISLHTHNEKGRTEALLPRLLQGECGALISDAGTPLISDPGATFVATLRQAGVQISPVPGPSAVIAALSAAGLPTARFTFEGFLPAKSAARRKALQALAGMPYTRVFYEAPHRLMETLSDMRAVWGGEAACVVARELTKKFESFIGMTLNAVMTHFESHPEEVRGELVILLGPDCVEETVTLPPQALNLAVQLLREGISPKRVAQLVAEAFDLRRNQVYRQVQDLKSAQ